MRNYDVLMNGGWWTVIRSDSKFLESSHATEEHATERASCLAQISGGKVTVHNETELLKNARKVHKESADRSRVRPQM